MAPAGAVLVGALLIVAVMPSNAALWAALHGTPAHAIVTAEDGTGVSAIINSGDETLVFANGLGQSQIPYGGAHTTLGVLPVLLHPEPRRVAMVGLGSGDTVFAAAARPDTRSVVCVEIAGAQLAALRTWSEDRRYPGLTRVLTDPRITHVVGDGRAFLRQAPPEFDIIEADALRPTSAYAGHLYSREYFELVRQRLAPGGLAVSWVPTPRTRDTFLAVFPHALVFDDIIVGSAEPVVFDRLVIEARARGVSEYFAAAGVDVLSLLQPYLEDGPERIGPESPRRASDLNTDLFPRDEFSR